MSTASPLPADQRATGLASAVGAYLAWGFLPVYFKALGGVPALEVLAHRIAWSVLLLGAVAVLLRRGAEVRRAFAAARSGILVATAVLIAVNWLLYIWAVQHGRVLEASLGYFVNPLVNVLLGVAFLRERLTRLQGAAVALAGAGVLALVLRAGTFPWIALTLATSFGLYGLLRKKARIDAVAGLLAETALLAPAAIAFLWFHAAAGDGALGHDPRTTVLLVAAGPITSLPLVAFAAAVNRLRLSTMGLVQYLAPTCQFLLAVLVYGEPFGAAHALAFACIWTSLALYSGDALARARRLAV